MTEQSAAATAFDHNSPAMTVRVTRKANRVSC